MLPKVLRFSLIFVLTLVATLLVTHLVRAHGSLWNPISRIYICYLENPESPDTLPCQDLVNLSGTQPLYDWTEVNIRDAGENSRALIPDGHLCSAGREKYYGLDQARADWPVSLLPSSGMYTFQWAVTADHPVATFRFYVTKNGYDPTVPLKWSDLEDTPFLTFDNPTAVNVGLQYPAYQFTGQLPNKTGRHLIYVIWTRHDSLENFYSCSDVWFGTSPTPTPTPAPACIAPAWQSGTYAAGSVVSFNNKEWVARWSNSEQPSTAPLSAAWKLQANCTSGPGGPTATRTNTPVGPSATPTRTATRTNTPVGPSATPTRTTTRTLTPVGPSATPTRTATRTNTPVGPSATPTRTLTPAGSTPTPVSGLTCSPVTATITAPFIQDGAGTFCWQSTNLGAYINSWNTANLTVNGVNFTNLYVPASGLPAKINGFWYVSYTGNFPWSHFEAK